MVKKDIQNIRSVKKKKNSKEKIITAPQLGNLQKKKKFCLHHTSLFPKKKENSI